MELKAKYEPLNLVRGDEWLRPWQAYLLAILATAATIDLRLALVDEVAGQPTFIIFMVPITLSAYLGGLRAGLLATTIAMVGACYYLLPPVRSFAVDSNIELWQLFILALAGVFTSVLSELLKRARRRAEQSEDKYHRLFDHMSEAFALHELILDAEGKPCDSRFLDLNPAWEKQTNISRREMIGKTMKDTWPAVARYWLDIFSQAVVTGEPIRFETQNDESQRWYEVFTFSAGPLQVGCLFLDITERKRAEEVKERALQRLSEAQRIGKIGDWEVDLAPDRISWSPQVFEILGRDPRHGPPRDFKEVVAMYDAASRTLLAESVARVIASGEPQDYELVAQRPDGERVHLQANAVARKDASGRVVGLFGTVQDITQRKLAAAALHDSEKKLSAVMEHMSEGVMIADAERNVIYQNPASLRILGFEANDAGRITNQDLPGDWQGWDEEGRVLNVEDWPIYRVLRGERVENQVLKARRLATGHEVLASYNGSPIYDDFGRLVVSFITIHDITERSRAESDLHDSHALLKVAGRMAHFGGWSVNLADGQQTWSDEVARIHDEPLGHVPSVKSGVNYYAPEWKQKIAGVFDECVRDGTPYDEEVQIVTARGRRVWVRVIGAPVRNIAGEIVRVQGAFQDITERREAELRVREREELLRLFVEHSPAAIAMVDQHMRYVVVSHRWLSDYGLHQRDVVGLSHYELFPDIPERWKDIHRRCLAGAIERDDTDEFPRADGSLDWIRWEIRPWRKAHGEIGGLIIFSEIVTERVRAEADIRRLNATLEQSVIERTAQLEAANQELDAFSYSVSHDLRAPLRAMDGFSQAVLEDFGPQLPAEAQRQLQIIRGSAQRMGALIDDLQGLSRLTRAPLRVQKFDTGTLVRGVLDELQRQYEGRRIELRIGELPACTGDPALLRQVWLNLLSNAFKYTLKCEAAIVEAGCEARPGGTTYFVRDNGAGFDMRYVDKLFGVFQRLHRAEDYEGTGVGLAIVQRVIHRHGGRVWAEAAVDRGATFFFTLNEEAQP